MNIACALGTLVVATTLATSSLSAEPASAPVLPAGAIQVPAGTRLQPHWHPRDERVTVLSGEVLVGFGDTFDEDAMTRFTAGSFYVNQADSPHFIWFKSESVIQITGNVPGNCITSQRGST